MTGIIETVIRSFEEGDRHFIVDSWSRQLKEAKPYSYCPSHIYFPQQIKLITDILQHSETIVACLSDEPDTLVGYLTYEHVENTLVIHWVCVKKDFRGNGIMKGLLSAAHPTWEKDIIMCTQPGKLFSTYKKKYRIYYDAFRLYGIYK